MGVGVGSGGEVGESETVADFQERFWFDGADGLTVHLDDEKAELFGHVQGGGVARREMKIGRIETVEWAVGTTTASLRSWKSSPAPG